MWLTDLQKAIAILLDRGYNETLVEKVVPSGDSNILAIFFTTYHTRVCVYKSGLIAEYDNMN